MAREVRLELGLAPQDPLDPWKLASHLAIPVRPLSSLQDESPLAVRHFGSSEPERFSAVTVFVGAWRVIVHNDAHSRGRQSSNLGHELGHALLLHPSAPAVDKYGCRNWDATLEEEANWLAGALLVSEEAAVNLARGRVPLNQAALAYGVSEQMMDWRLNVTGAKIRAQRRAAKLRKPAR
jgi:Zn-dependent peptidase ImmA (M78 family)